MLRTGVLGLVAAAIVLVAAPAQADSTTPTVDYPLARIGATADVEVMIEAPLKAWGIRSSAKFYDAQVDGLTIHTRGTCYARPQAVCVRVSIDSYSDDEMWTLSGGQFPTWRGLTLYQADPTAPRAVYLNARYGLNRRAARHELGHVLGLGHTDAPTGVMGPAGLFPSPEEIDALRAHYSVPPA